MLRYQTRHKFLWRVILLSHNDLELHTSEQAQFTTPVILVLHDVVYLKHNTPVNTTSNTPVFRPPTTLYYWCVKSPAHNSHQAYYWCVMCRALKNSLVCLNNTKDIRKESQTSSEALSPILYDFQFYSADLLNSVRTTQKHISDHKVIISPTSENLSSFLVES